MAEIDEVKRFREFVATFPTQRAAAKALRVSDVYVSDMLNERRGISKATLAKLGLKRAVVKDRR
jgi:plasmid maintenance system antidote protein VapI